MIFALLLAALAEPAAQVDAGSCPELSMAAPHGGGGPMASTTLGSGKKVPPPRRHIPVPEGDLASVRIRLERSACFGTCPVYSVELRGDGSGVFDGREYVLVSGKHSFKVRPQLVQCLVERFRAADFWSLASAYSAPVTDLPTSRLTLQIVGKSKSLTDYAGEMVGMPHAVTELEQAIDRAGGDPWVTGDARTLAALRAEGFDFRSAAAGAVLAGAADSGPDELVMGLLAAGAPPDGRRSGGFSSSDQEGPTALGSAVRRGRANVVSALIAAGALAKASSDEKEWLLQGAASSGAPEVVAEILKLGPNPNFRDGEGKTALMHVQDAIYSEAAVDMAETARLLLAAGADPRLKDNDGSTALHFANGAAFVRVLVKAGAELEARNGRGETPLLTANDDDAALALIEAGGNVHAKSDAGATVRSFAAQYRYVRTLAWLDAHGVP